MTNTKNKTGGYGRRTGSFARGYKLVKGPSLSLIEEAKKNLEAVVSRLFREGRDDEAEEIFDMVME